MGAGYLAFNGQRPGTIKERGGALIPIITPPFCLHFSRRTSPPLVSCEVQERPSHTLPLMFSAFPLFYVGPAHIARHHLRKCTTFMH